MFKVNNKNTGMMSTVNSEQVNVSWVVIRFYLVKP